jgi:hypothetical protein
MAAQSWYEYYNLSNLSVAKPKHKTAGAFLMPNTSTSEFPPNYGPYHAVTSSATRPPNQIFSGIEPLIALPPNELKQHFDSTSVPETAQLIGKRSMRYNRPILKRASQNLLKDMDMAVEFY